MEWILLLGIIGGGYWWYVNKSPQSQTRKKVIAFEALFKEADEAYIFYSQALDDILKKDLPKWIKEAQTNLSNWKRDFPNQKPPNSITWQPDKQAARKKDIEQGIKELERVKNKFMRVALRHVHNKDVDMKLENLYDWHQWIVRKAEVYNFHGIDKMLYINDDDKKVWEIKFEEIEKRFDDRLKN